MEMVKSRCCGIEVFEDEVREIECAQRQTIGLQDQCRVEQMKLFSRQAYRSIRKAVVVGKLSVDEEKNSKVWVERTRQSRVGCRGDRASTENGASPILTSFHMISIFSSRPIRSASRS